MVPKAKVAQDAADLYNIIQLCEKFNCLPNPGGLMNQDSLFVLFLRSYVGWEIERSELDQAKEKRKMPQVPNVR